LSASFFRVRRFYSNEPGVTRLTSRCSQPQVRVPDRPGHERSTGLDQEIHEPEDKRQQQGCERNEDCRHMFAPPSCLSINGPAAGHAV